MADDTLAVNLKILSPSSELESGIHLRDLPASTTVKELRLLIQHAVPSKPGPERMRLIYRGKVVANDADSLEAVFGADNIRDSKDQSLHLVLRELPQPASTSSTPLPRTATASTSSTSSTPAPRTATASTSSTSSTPAPRTATASTSSTSSTPAPRTATASTSSTPAPPNPFRPAQPPLPASPPLQTNPFRAIPQPRPNSQPQPHHHHHPHHPHVHHHHHVQQPLNPLAPMGAMPLPPQMQQQIAQALGQRGTPIPTPAPGTPVQQAEGTVPVPADGAAPTPGVLPPNGRTVRQEGIGPNGARWSVTYNDFTANMPLRPGQPTLPRPVPHPAAFALPPRPFGSPPPGRVSVPLSWLLPRLRGTLQEAAREVDNVRTLLDPPNAPDSTSTASVWPSWRVDRIREHLRTITHNLNMVESGLSDPAMQLNMDVIALRQAAVEVRRQANDFSRTLDAQEARVSAGLAQSTTPAEATAAASDPLIATASAATRTLPSDAPQELFLLSSPQGPVGVLFDQRGTYTTTPFASNLPSQAFVDHFSQNRQLIAGLGQQIAQSAQNLHNRLGGVQPTPTQQPDHALDHTAAQRVIDRIMQGPNQNQNQNQNQDQNQNQAAPANVDAPAENDRVVNVAGHLWLIFKLACFVYIFAGGGGWYRPLMLGSIALIVYIVQLGIFEAQFNVMRRHFEALLPNAERLVQGRGANTDQNPANGGAADARRPLTPEEAARRLLQQQRAGQFSWARDAMRTLERGVALFVASLWPGIGERMVHAQEERERLARVAASEERERLEEEQRRQEAEAANTHSTTPPEDQKKEETEPETEKPPLQRTQTESLAHNFMDRPLDTNTNTTDDTTNTTNINEKGKQKAAESESEPDPTQLSSSSSLEPETETETETKAETEPETETETKTSPKGKERAEEGGTSFL
ncbi:hypothetical protein M3J09_007795 [Ascochyta lentis]